MYSNSIVEAEDEASGMGAGVLDTIAKKTSAILPHVICSLTPPSSLYHNYTMSTPAVYTKFRLLSKDFPISPSAQDPLVVTTMTPTTIASLRHFQSSK